MGWSALGEPTGVGLFKKSMRPLKVARALLESVEIPLGARPTVEVAAVNVEGDRELPPRVRHRMDGIRAHHEYLTRGDLPPAGALEPGRCSTVEGVVLLAAVHADDGPHAVLMR